LRCLSRHARVSNSFRHTGAVLIQGPRVSVFEHDELIGIEQGEAYVLQRLSFP
jgi:hypothetical protein